MRSKWNFSLSSFLTKTAERISIKLGSYVLNGGGGGLVAKSCPTLATLWTVACQAPLSMGISRQEYWSRLSFSPPGDLPKPGTEPRSPASPALEDGFFATSTTWETHGNVDIYFLSDG